MSWIPESPSAMTIAVVLALLALLTAVALADVLRRAKKKLGDFEPGDPSGGNAGGQGQPARGEEREPPAVQFAPIGPLFEATRVRPERATAHPIVLVHGYFGFGELGVSRLRREYFRGVRKRLEAMGHEVHVVRVPAAAGIEIRAAELARQILRLPAPRVNLIAHSMGGLDARYAISHLGLAERVASLVTVGTPHRGTPVADRSTRFFGEWRRARRALHALGANVDGLYDLTTHRMEEFNRKVPDVPSVTYVSVVGAVADGRAGVPPFLARAHRYLSRVVGPNDGLVPADSQRWGHVLGEIDASHWAQIGWAGGFDARGFYATIAAHLAETGH